MTTELSPQQVMEHLVDTTPLRPIHYRLWLISTGGTFIDGFATLWGCWCWLLPPICLLRQRIVWD